MYEDLLKYYPGFPIEGVNFVDIIPLMQDKETFKSLIKDLGKLIGSPNVAAPEARGFLFAAPMLVSCDNVVNVIPMRKKGKLPYTEGDLVGVDITKEYGKDKIFFRLSDVAAGVPEGDTFNVTFFDDILATGGTAKGIAEGLEQHKVVIGEKEYGIKVTDFVFLAELDDLNGRALIEDVAPVKSLIHIAGTD
jgi:adenine phosphoribosyltransferase